MSSWPAGETEGAAAAAAAHKDGLKTAVAAPHKHFSPLHLRWSGWVTSRALINTQAICLSPPEIQQQSTQQDSLPAPPRHE